MTKPTTSYTDTSKNTTVYTDEGNNTTAYSNVSKNKARYLNGSASQIITNYLTDGSNYLTNEDGNKLIFYSTNTSKTVYTNNSKPTTVYGEA